MAGPSGGTKDKPVGLVYFGVARRGGQSRTERLFFTGGRAGIRRAATRRAL
ncbi:MAG: CinA family protein [Stellaceae bacterium]